VTLGAPLSTAHLPRPDPARGVFETLLVVDGRPIGLDAHLDRLAASVRELFGPPTLARVAGPARTVAATRAAELEGLARLRLTLAPDGAGRLDLSATTAAVPGEAVFPRAERAPSLVPIAVPGGLGAHKWADRRLLEGAAAELAGDRPALPLIVDGDGTVLEADRANVFAVRDGALVTPPLDGRILPGVARAQAIEIAGELGIPVAERPLTADDLGAADELFLTGSVRGIEPLPAAGDAAPVAARLAAALRTRWL
jgi:para-aminobenzoate synthetase/4-amino-4-deoxychorismate lyase